MRDKLIHGHFAVDLDLVWKTVVGEFPALESRLEALVDELPEDPAPA